MTARIRIQADEVEEHEVDAVFRFDQYHAVVQGDDLRLVENAKVVDAVGESVKLMGAAEAMRELGILSRHDSLTSSSGAVMMFS